MWEPFRPGHTRSVVHGGDSTRLLNIRADEIEPLLVEAAPWLGEPRFQFARRNIAQVIGRSRALGDHIERTVIEKGAGVIGSRLWESASAASRLEDQLLEQNGLTPLGRIKVLREQAEASKSQLDLARAWQDDGDGS